MRTKKPAEQVGGVEKSTKFHIGIGITVYSRASFVCVRVYISQVPHVCDELNINVPYTCSHI